ncbi:MAG: hypothetical protein DI535_25665 [Citrobacter freundii]|nr:MAG: hypothetical protein DI535_25665 [Citrobacter freundii]
MNNGKFVTSALKTGKMINLTVIGFQKPMFITFYRNLCGWVWMFDGGCSMVDVRWSMFDVRWPMAGSSRKPRGPS